MTRRYVNLSLVYALLGMAAGVFYREYTKFSGFAGQTSLGFMHVHYLVLGMAMFLLLALLEKAFAFSGEKHVRWALIVYQAGLNVTGLGFLLRGLAQVSAAGLSRGLDASISGIAGLGHIAMGVGLVALLLSVRKHAA